MQTMVQLDDTLAAQATRLASENGCDLPHFIEEAVREKVAQAPGSPSIVPQPFTRLTTFGTGGLRAGVNLDDSAALLDLMDRPA
jgi:hypothetical protein